MEESITIDMCIEYMSSPSEQMATGKPYFPGNRTTTVEHRHQNASGPIKALSDMCGNEGRSVLSLYESHIRVRL